MKMTPIKVASQLLALTIIVSESPTFVAFASGERTPIVPTTPVIQGAKSPNYVQNNNGMRTLIVSDNDDNPLKKEQLEDMRRLCAGVKRVRHLKELNFDIIHTIDNIAAVECVTDWLYNHSEQINLVAEDEELALEMSPNQTAPNEASSDDISKTQSHNDSDVNNVEKKLKSEQGRQLSGDEDDQDLNLDALDSEQDENDNQDENQDDPGVTIPGDPHFSHQWALNQDSDIDVNAPEAWESLRSQVRLEAGGTPKPTIIAVIDSGIDYNHEDLKGKLWRNPREIPNNGIDDDYNGYIDDIHGADIVNEDGDPMDEDPFSHGTHVAGIIAASADNGKGIAGIAAYLPENTIQIMAIKVFTANSGRSKTGSQETSSTQSSGLLHHFLEACEYALKMGARLSNHSYGVGVGKNTPNIEQMFIEAFTKLKLRHDHIAFVSAGNQGALMDGHYVNENKNMPCGTFFVDNVICVGSIRGEDGHLSESSNWGSAVHVAAPGERVVSTGYSRDLRNGVMRAAGDFDPLYGSLLPMNRVEREKSYVYGSGTSVATAHVTGLAALLLGLRPNLNSDEVMKLILENVDKKDHLKGKLKTEGVVNLENSIRKAIANFKAPEGPSSKVTRLSIFRNRDTNQRPGVFSGRIVLRLRVAQCNFEHADVDEHNESDFVEKGEIQLWFLNKKAERIGLPIKYLNKTEQLKKAMSLRGSSFAIVDQPIPPDAKYIAAFTTWKSELEVGAYDPNRYKVLEHTHHNGALTFGAWAELKDNASGWKVDKKLQPRGLVLDDWKTFYWSGGEAEKKEKGENEENIVKQDDDQKKEEKQIDAEKETSKKAELALNFDGSISFLPPEIGESEITHYNVYRGEWFPCNSRQSGPGLASQKVKALQLQRLVCWAVCPFLSAGNRFNGENEKGEKCVRSEQATAVERAQALITTIPAMNYRKPYCVTGSEDEKGKSCDFITGAQQNAVDSEALKERFGERFSDDIHTTTHIAYDSDTSQLAKNGEREHAWIVVTGPGILEFAYLENLTREEGLLSYPKRGQLFHGSTSQSKKLREIHFGPGKHSIEWSALPKIEKEGESRKRRKWELKFHSTARYTNIPIHFPKINYHASKEVYSGLDFDPADFISSSIIVVPAYKNINGMSVEVNTRVVGAVDVGDVDYPKITEETEGKATEVIQLARPPFAKPVFAEFFDQNGDKNGFCGRVKLVAQKNGISDRSKRQSGTVRLRASLGWYNDVNAIEDLTRKQPDGFLWNGSCDVRTEDFENDFSCEILMREAVLKADGEEKKWCLFVTEESFVEEMGVCEMMEDEPLITNPTLPPFSTLITRIADVTYPIHARPGNQNDNDLNQNDNNQNDNNDQSNNKIQNFLSFHSSMHAKHNDMRLSGAFHINAASFSKQNFVGLTGFRMEFEDADLNASPTSQTPRWNGPSLIGDILLPYVCGGELANLNGAVHANEDITLPKMREEGRIWFRDNMHIPAAFGFAPGNCVGSASFPEKSLGPLAPKCIPAGFSFDSLFKKESGSSEHRGGEDSNSCTKNNVEITLKEMEESSSPITNEEQSVTYTIKKTIKYDNEDFFFYFPSGGLLTVRKTNFGVYGCGTTILLPWKDPNGNPVDLVELGETYNLEGWQIRLGDFFPVIFHFRSSWCDSGLGNPDNSKNEFDPNSKSDPNDDPLNESDPDFIGVIFEWTPRNMLAGPGDFSLLGHIGLQSASIRVSPIYHSYDLVKQTEALDGNGKKTGMQYLIEWDREMNRSDMHKTRINRSQVKAPGVSINLNLENKAIASCTEKTMMCWVPIGLERNFKPKWLERYNVKEEPDENGYKWTPMWATVSSSEQDEGHYCGPMRGINTKYDESIADLSEEDKELVKQRKLGGSYFMFLIGTCGSSKHTAYDLESGKVKTHANALIASLHMRGQVREGETEEAARKDRVFMDCRCEMENENVENEDEGGKRRLSLSGNSRPTPEEAARMDEEMEKQVAAFEKKQLEKKDTSQQDPTSLAATPDSQLELSSMPTESKILSASDSRESTSLALSAQDISAPKGSNGRNKDFTQQPDFNDRKKERVTVVWEEDADSLKKSSDTFELGLAVRETKPGSAASLLPRKKTLENALKQALLANSAASVMTVSITSISKVATDSDTSLSPKRGQKSLKSTRVVFRVSFDSDFFRTNLEKESSTGNLSKPSKLRLQLESRARLLAQNAPSMVEKFVQNLRAGSRNLRSGAKNMKLKIKKDDINFMMVEK